LDEVLETEIPKLMEAADIPGLSMAVVLGGEIYWSGAFGLGNRDTNEAVDENTMFEAASLTKTITAAAALKLVERGELELDKPLVEYLPYPKLAKDTRYEKLTARHVLTHTSGLPNWGVKFMRDPGERFGYSGEGFLYLGRVVAKIAGVSLEEFAKREIFEPLGMLRTSYVWNDLYAANGATGHDRHGFAGQKRKVTKPNGGASLLTTARDYAVFLCAIMNDEILAPKTIEMMLTPHVRATKWEDRKEVDANVCWGFGWGIQTGNTENGFFHWGDNGTLRAYTVSYKDKKDGLIVLANSENLFTIADSLVALVLPDRQYALDWLTYERLDNPDRMARMSVEKAFLTEGADAGVAKLKEMKSLHPDLFKPDWINQLASYLVRREKEASAEPLFHWMLDANPKSVTALAGLGRLYFMTGRNEEALEQFESILKFSSKNRQAARYIPWIEEVIEAEDNPVVIPIETIEKFAGDYGPRRITERDGRLFYQRDDGKERELLPLTQDTFILKDYGVFRLKFVADKDGSITKVEGIYIEGHRDESQRKQ
jgi:CubicO group peptidase (beta-lactamase class C family)